MNTVLFDLDGTLMDTPRVIVGSLRHVLGAASAEYVDADLARQVGRPLDAIMADLFPDASSSDIEDKKHEFREAFSVAIKTDTRDLVFTSIRDLLDDLGGEGMTTAVVTSKVTMSALELLNAGGIRSSFAAVVGHDQAVAGKPSPHPALLAASRLRSEPGQCIVVGDSPDDMRMGASAGMPAIGVTWGVGDRDALHSSGASGIADSVEELRESILAAANRIAVQHRASVSGEPAPYA